MFKEFSGKKAEFSKKKPEKTLDYYIDKHSVQDSSVTGLSKNAEEESEEEIFQKHEFLKKSVKASAVVPDSAEKVHETPDNFGYFESKFGTIAVGHKKFKKQGDMVFSIVPDAMKEREDIPNNKLGSAKTYFGGEANKKKKSFKAGELSFKYNPKASEISKLYDDEDSITDQDDKLLYQDKKEDENLELWRKERNQTNSQAGKLDKDIEITEEVKKQKEEDNLAFLKELNNFINLMEKGKLKKVISADEVISRRKRIIELSSNLNLELMDLAQLKRLLEKLLKKEKLKKVPDMPSKEELKKMTKENAKEIILRIMRRLPGASLQ